MQLQRYHLWCIKTIIAGKNEYFVKFNKTTVQPKCFFFASTLIITNPSLASQQLSLTYLPRHRYLFESNALQLFNNEGKKIKPQDSEDFLRVWPAFGKYGGGFEVLVETKNSEITPMSDNILIDGGLVDRFHQDAVLPMTEKILQLIYSQVNNIFHQEIGTGLVKEGLPVFKWRMDQNNFTISVGIKETPDGMILHIWGAKWRDFNSFRCVFRNFEDEFQAFLIGRDELENRFKNDQDGYFKNFSKKIEKVITELKECEEEYPLLRYCIPTEHIFKLPQNSATSVLN